MAERSRAYPDLTWRLIALVASLIFVGSSGSSVPAGKVPGHVGSSACQSCHVGQTKAWANSHHSWALREPRPENVLGDFNDRSFTQGAVTSRFFRRDGRYFVETDDASGRIASFEIRYVVGVTPLQQYLVETSGGRLQTLDIAWDSVARRWFHLYPAEDVSPGNGLHWTGPYKNWQARCAVCHQTDFRKNYDPETRSYQTKWSELTIGCEACHGPGEAHIAWSRKPGGFDATLFDNIDALGLIRPHGATRQAREDDLCGTCHSRREQIGADSPLPGAAFGDHYRLDPLSEGRYFHDGQQNDEVYILGSFLQSRMHAKGVTCTNCHEPHAGTLLANGNAVCTQCHNAERRADFPTLKKKVYDAPAHHRHLAGSSGAQCVNCHMPERKYMSIDGRRDHFFRVPDPLLSKKVGAPDACTGCHVGKTAEWAATSVAQWAPPHVSPAALYAEAFAMAGPGSGSGVTEAARGALIAVVRDATQSAIARAAALIRLADDGEAFRRLPVSDLLGDPSDLIRAAAARLARTAPEGDRLRLLLPVLRDPVAAVRLAAAIELSAVSPAGLAEEERNSLVKALDEFEPLFSPRRTSLKPRWLWRDWR